MARKHPYRAEETARILARTPVTLPCLNPLCHVDVDYKQQRGGLQAAFCSSHCDTDFHDERERLLDALDMLERSQPADADETRTLRDAKAKLRWTLDHYRIK